MEKKICIIPFQTENNRYVFDGVTSEIIPSSLFEESIIMGFYEKSRDELWDMWKDKGIGGEAFERKYHFISELIESGMFYLDERIPKPFDKQPSDYIYKVQNMSLLLVLTEKCNFRCEYCVYSDKYPDEMTYSQEEMSIETAQMAVDEYVQLFRERVKRGFTKRPSILFYGGEPLLRMELIKQVVDYVKNIQFDCDFYVTTNAFLLNKENAEYFVENDFNITFSLDGYKENHDRNRITVSGKPTFDIVLRHLLQYQRIKKENNKQSITTFNCCYDNYTDLRKCIRFFEEHKSELEPIHVVYSMISPYDTLYYNWVNESLQEKEGYSAEAFAKSYYEIKKDFLDEKYNDTYEKSLTQNLFIGEFAIAVRGKWNKQEFNNSCIPLSKLAVYPDGTYTLCEKMNKKLPIGNTVNGIEYKNVSELSKKFVNNFENGKCAACPVKRICNVCFQFMDKDGMFNEEFCKREFESAQKRLTEFCSMYEKNPEFLTYFKSMEKEADILELLG